MAKRKSKKSDGYSDTYRYFGVPSTRRDSVDAGLIAQGSSPQSANGYSDTYRYFGVPSTTSDPRENPVQYVESQPISWAEITDTIPANNLQQVPAGYGFSQSEPGGLAYTPSNVADRFFAEMARGPDGQSLLDDYNNMLYGGRIRFLNDMRNISNDSRRYVNSALNGSEYVPYEPPPMVIGRILDKYSRPAAMVDSSPKPRISPVGLITEPVGYYK